MSLRAPDWVAVSSHSECFVLAINSWYIVDIFIFLSMGALLQRVCCGKDLNKLCGK
jgi:hypothetical protein